METITGRAGFIAKMHVIKLRGYSLNDTAHAGIGCINLAEIADLSVPARIGNCDCVLQLGNIDSDESFSIIVTARLLPRGICLDACGDLFVEDEAIEELLPCFRRPTRVAEHLPEFVNAIVCQS